MDRARPGRTAVETIAVTAPLFHVEPVLQTCTVALIRMFQSEGFVASSACLVYLTFALLGRIPFLRCKVVSMRL